MLKVGDKAPDFCLKGEDYQNHELKHYKGNKVILYFYPRDNTPGCTKEACAFKDHIKEIKKKKAVVLGVSSDSIESHKKFVTKYELPFHLLSDPKRDVIKTYGAWQKKSMYGREYMGIARITYIIDEKGKIAHVFPKVKPAEHAKEILELI